MTSNADITVTLDSKVLEFEYDMYNLDFESSADEVLSTLRPVIIETEGVDITEDDTFIVKYLNDQKQLAIFPKSTAG